MPKGTTITEATDGDLGDGYPSFGELYAHSMELFIALMKSFPSISWRANNNAKGSNYPGWFLAGMALPSGDISYHLPAEKWMELDGFGIATSNKAPTWDGHTSVDVLQRLKKFQGASVSKPKEFK